MLSITEKLAQDLKVKINQVQAAIDLLDEGATVPFIARYRKEATRGLDDTQLRQLETNLSYLRELGERREVIINSIREQGKLSPELEKALLAADTKMRLEDLYLPYKPKRRTKAEIARLAGLEPLAHGLVKDPSQVPQTLAEQFINVEHQIEDAKQALEGARQILMEEFAENADLLDRLREHLWAMGVLSAKVSPGQEKAGKKYSDYFEFSEGIKKIPSHRALALFRGRREGILQLNLSLPDNPDFGESEVALAHDIKDCGQPACQWLLETVRWTWKIKLFTKLELELMTRLREQSELEAIKVFARNLRDLLLAAPAGRKITLGLDPGIRTGVKVVIIDDTGKLLDYTTIFPLAPKNEWHQSIAEIAKLASKYQVNIISIGNGTGSRETERLMSELIKMYPDLSLEKIVVSEAGASVYSASELAAKEFPELDVSLRGAVSIARRLQDPLAELVKIDPESIGVGQYQHDVNKTRLARSLDGVVEDCVNAVGVDVNTASPALLKRVSGLNETLAKNIVEYRDKHGAFINREQLKLVARMGEKTYQQAAGFLRINQGDNPLDGSSVHPEAYPLVEKIMSSSQKSLQQLIGNKELLGSINAADYVDEEHGLPTIQDILSELDKPGRDPRPHFKTVKFKEGVEEIKHLEEGMILDGVVSNVANFGAFVDIGVHQDGLVHISELTDKFIDDPRKIVKAGDIITVRVIEVNTERKRISLSMKLSQEAKRPAKATQGKAQNRHKTAKKPQGVSHKKPAEKKAPALVNTAMADALSKLKRGQK